MSERVLNRRDLLRELGCLAGGLLAAPWACAGRPPEVLALTPPPSPGHSDLTGLQSIGLDGEREAVLYAPASALPSSPLILMLHGAGGSGRRAVGLMQAAADATGCLLLAPDSRAETWDAVSSRFGPDPRFIERALAATADRRAVDASRMAVAGFSDGATYALALGRANGALFSHVLAFSPGFLLPTHPAGSPRIYVSHGRSDQILPIDATSRMLVRRLRRDGYDVRYREFDGRHEVPPGVAREAVNWFLDGSAGRAPAPSQ